MNVIFLDIDGVLNTPDFTNNINKEMIDFDFRLEENLAKLQMSTIDMSKVALIKELSEKTNSKIVIISSWKTLQIYPLIEKEFIAMGIPIIGKTPDLNNQRGEEIRTYIGENEIDNFVILDDSYYEDYEAFSNNFIKIDREYGITLAQKDLAEKILKSTNL